MTVSEQRSESSFLRGIWSINASMFSFTVGDIILKVFGRYFPPIELIFIRSVVIAAALAIAMIATRRLPRMRTATAPSMLARSLFDCINIFTFTVAVVHMQLPEIYAVLLTAPFMLTILATVFFHEPVGHRRWLAIIGGFCGVLLVIKPNPFALDKWAFLALACAAAGAARDTVTRTIDQKTPAIEVTFYSAVFAAAGSLAFGIHEWVPLTQPLHLLVIVQAASYLVGMLLLVHACRIAPLSVVAAFRYTLLIWGGLAGYFIFGQVPDLWSIIGTALIATCGLYTFHREAVRRRPVASNVVALN
ncbi:MAG TPA: DMT family transporter [Xanthobacteraceae bacterium]|nr:DMT family transporter [Xanthobacteraceae bacterium]